MSFIGTQPGYAYNTITKDTFSGNDSDTDFTLSTAATTNGVEVFVENVQQEPTTAYTVSGTTLSFTAAPVSGSDNIYVVHRNPTVQTLIPPNDIAVNVASITTTGSATIGDGLTVDNDGATVATFDRATSDGDIAVFQKDGSTVGSIGAFSGDAYFGTGDIAILAYDNGNAILPYNTSTGAYADNFIDLGVATQRFKSIYLSGGVYLGGTTSANFLNDYEEGTWTPTVDTGSVSVLYAKYTKIGNLVNVSGLIYNFSDRSSASAILVSLPFAVEATETGGQSPSYRYINVDNNEITFYAGASGSKLNLFHSGAGGWANVTHSDLNNSGSRFFVNFTYRTT